VNINEPSDELWKISKVLFESDVVIFFSSVRWGQANMYYQNLMERLTWIQNRHTTLGESNLIKDIESGYICTGQNWNGNNVVDTQKESHEYYGFKINDSLYWNWWIWHEWPGKNCSLRWNLSYWIRCKGI
jgi:multimeric flavodoxin WrbA